MASPAGEPISIFSLSIAFLYLMLLASEVSAAEPWTAHMGSHYRIRDWAASVRDPGGVGVFAGMTDQRQNETLKSFVARNGKDVILGAGGLGSGRSRQMVGDFMDRMAADQGEGWKRELREKVAAVNHFSSRTGVIAWQFGNEINSPRFGKNLGNWQGNEERRSEHESSIISLYVEYYLAPGVEALRSASTIRGESPLVVLGSVASFANPGAQRFMDQLLGYQVKGAFAPSLKGKKVYEFVNVLAVHYVTTANRGDWRTALDQLHRRWMGKGAVSAIWSTEELGIRRARANGGAVFALEVLARYLGWWYQKGMDSSAGKAFLWGSDVGATGFTGDSGMDFLMDEVGRAVLVPDQRVQIEGENLESYEYRVKDSRSRLLFVFPRDQRRGATIKQLSLGGLKSSNAKLETRSFSSSRESSAVLEYDGSRGLVEPYHLPPVSALVVRIDG